MIEQHKRLALWVVLVVVWIFLIALTFYGYVISGDSARGEEALPVDAALVALDRRALTSAYEAHLVKLFSVWLADGAITNTHITIGLRNARRAYAQAAAQLAKREQELKKPGD